MGAIGYVLWGLTQLIAAYKVYALAQGFDGALVQARVLQTAYFLAFFAVFAIVVGAGFNWRNSGTGYWANLIAVTAAEAGFIALILAPGHVALWPGMLGPVLWLAALVLTTLGYVNETSSPARYQPASRS